MCIHSENMINDCFGTWRCVVLNSKNKNKINVCVGVKGHVDNTTHSLFGYQQFYFNIFVIAFRLTPTYSV